ncbi:Methyltransferase-like protein 22 [Bagarius yarrelli]|uniref:Methyltransferase-like protein 22 n=1 Tax=Bagarius yarrelli TaxID=175774 RepID=A0A556VVX6_BAGYA|nr:Methyltransferase-like protein 22 [Bagarius yarrelli]
MDQITFRSDTVLSDVHLLIPNARHLMTRLNSAGQPAAHPASSSSASSLRTHSASPAALRLERRLVQREDDQKVCGSKNTAGF